MNKPNNFSLYINLYTFCVYVYTLRFKVMTEKTTYADWAYEANITGENPDPGFSLGAKPSVFIYWVTQKSSVFIYEGPL